MSKKNIVTAAILSTLATSAMAFDSSRLSGEFILATGFTSSNSNLNTENDAVRSGEGNQKGSHNSEFIAMPLGSLSYELVPNGTQRVYLGTSRDDLAVGDLAFEIGYQFDMRNGTQIDLAYLPTVLSGEVWKDPYASGARQTTDVDGHAYRVKLNHIAGSNFSLDMAYATTEVEQELIADKELHRDSDKYFVKGSYLHSFAPTMGLVTSLAYLNNDAKGSAETYNQYELEMTYFMSFNAHSLAVTGSYGYRDYDGINKAFDHHHKVRTDHRHKLFLAYEYANIAGWDNWNLVSFAGVNINDSNINFYSHEDYLASVGLSYKF